MKRAALLIGNSNGLSGVKKDIFNMKSYLYSIRGGAWEYSEITQLVDISKKDLLKAISVCKSSNPDFVFVYFSGHGGTIKRTILEINKENEKISETDLHNLAARQITILDCCRSVIPSAYADVELVEKSLNNRMIIREVYDKRNMKAAAQQAKLYACRVDEVAHDTEDGGAYTIHLLNALNSQKDAYVTINSAHQTTEISVPLKYPDQHPSHDLIRCMGDQQLIFGINPNLFYLR